MFARLARLACRSLAVPLVAVAVSAQTTWYVDVNATPPGNGTASNPFASIQYAIARPTTVNGDTVRVAAGTYFETIDFLGKSIEVVGWSGANLTIIDAGFTGSVARFVNGEGPGSVLSDFTLQHGLGPGVGAWSSGGGVYCSGASPTLEWLIVKLNQADQGAGIFLEASAASLFGCTISDNALADFFSGTGQGLGIKADSNSSPSISFSAITNHLGALMGGGINGPGSYSNCLIAGNAAYRGAGVHAGGGSLQLADCTITGNYTWVFPGDAQFGGGVVGPALLMNCTISSNQAFMFAGGAYGATLVDCILSGNVVRNMWSLPVVPHSGAGAVACTLTNCEVYANEAIGDDTTFGRSRGAGISGGSATNCRIYGNRAVSGEGGGAANADLVDCEVFDNEATVPTGDPNPTMGGGLLTCNALRCEVYRNVAPRGGGAAGGTLMNCTLYANRALIEGGGVVPALQLPDTITLTNSILWSNVPQEIALGSGSITVSYSDVRGGWPGTGNLSSNPRLWAPINDDFHLKPASPCIDAGDPGSPSDPDGSRVDIGAIPFTPGWCAMPGSYCLPKINSLGCAPSMGFTGAPSISGADDFHITGASFVNQKSGMMFWGRAHVLPPFAGGSVCVQGPLFRTPIQNGGGNPFPAHDCSGTYDFHLSHAYMSSHAIGAFDTIYAQYYSRDPSHPDGTGRSLSDALEFTICP